MIARLDGNLIYTIEQLHGTLKRALELPDHYGSNLDALWDCLTGWVDGPLTVEWVNFEESRRRLGEYADKVVDLFRDAQAKIPDLIIDLN